MIQKTVHDIHWLVSYLCRHIYWNCKRNVPECWKSRSHSIQCINLGRFYLKLDDFGVFQPLIMASNQSLGFFNIYENACQEVMCCGMTNSRAWTALRLQGLERTNGQTSIRARQAAHHTGRSGVELPNQAEGLADQLKKRAMLNLPCWYS
jgi:hypothetical protein